MPRLRGEQQVVARADDVRLAEVDARALAERRVRPLELQRAGAAEEVHVAPVDRSPGLFLAAVADAEVDLAMFALGDGDLHRHDLRLRPFGKLRLDVREIEGLEVVETPLAFLQLAEAIPATRTERELARDDVVADARIPIDRDFPVSRECPGHGRERDHPGAFAAAGALGEPHRRIGIPVILDLVERRLAGRLRQRAIERRCRLEREPLFHLVQMLFGEGSRTRRTRSPRRQPAPLRRCSA